MPNDQTSSEFYNGLNSNKPNEENQKILDKDLRTEMVKEPLDLNKINSLIDAGADINSVSNHGISLLMVVIAANNNALFDKLMSKDVNVNHVDNKGFNALITAAVIGNEHMVRDLLKAGADPLHKNKAQLRMPPIPSLKASEWASSKKHSNILSILMSAEHAALEKNNTGHSLLPQILVKPQPVAKTAVHTTKSNTISSSSVTLTPQSLQQAPKAPLNNTITPPFPKTKSQSKPVLSEFEQQFLKALLDKNHELLSKVLLSIPSTEKAKIINKRYENGATALMRAIEVDDLNMIKILIFHGADPMMKDSLNRTAQEQALNEGNPQVINYLLHVVRNKSTNASPSKQTLKSTSAPQTDPELELSLAIKLNKDINEIKNIIQRGSIDISKLNSKAQSYLVEAVQHNRLDVVNYLIGKRVNLDQEHNVYLPGRPSIPSRNQPQTTALIEAARLIGSTQDLEELKKTCAIINNLVDRGANIYKKDTTYKNMIDHLLPCVEHHRHRTFLIEQLQRNIPILSTMRQEKVVLNTTTPSNSSLLQERTESTLESPVLEEFNKKMNLFKDKIDNLIARRDHHKPDSKDYRLLENARFSANTLYNKLNEEKNTYLKKITPESYEHFEKNCKEHINTARTVLDQHRGWSEFLVNLAIGVTTLGIGLLIKGAVNLANNKSFLAVHQTDSSKKLDEIEDSIQNSKPKP
ncbi:ankyrin repeat domain-containing protein [Legionella bononiensis]|uniref:Ankyrin repeat domain-containing protein n=1 Tax=Legionella bononiensis TaxID=2793102 RepID=A0ABS1WCC9_9GAMM|nr:ankyrin repeat domain-containing protein [Legionella bononiensis]MBL7478879.1 ankyrin repeat domain-containing protein [Legionella bononiensis]MBL7527009.1 ankyrin repeat domain-containing protein [Legionella bononiensis]MBL7562397.1 ankyrin repeat domain-containing protein [Legionella bononiensis]